MTAEPVTPEPPPRVGRTLLVQHLSDVTFLHWPADPDRVAALLPPGVEPDLFDGVAYVGLVALRARLPYLGGYPQINVRVYSVDAAGRRGVVFRSLDAARPLPVLVARLALRLPYSWARMEIRRAGDVLTYDSRRRDRRRDARARLVVRIGEPIAAPTALDHFLTARWGLHTVALGRPRYLPMEHEPWPLRHAELLDLEESLVAAPGRPVSALYSPGVRARFGAPR